MSILKIQRLQRKGEEGLQYSTVRVPGYTKCIGRFLIACTRLLLYRTTVLPFYRVLPCFTGFYRVLPWCYRGATSVASRKRQETRPRRPPHGAHAARAPTKQQGHETPHCTARPRSPMSRSKTVYMKSAAPIPDAMKLLWEVLRR